MGVALALGGCGGSDDDGGDKSTSSAQKPAAEAASSLRCLQVSTVFPKPYDGSSDSDLEPAVRRLMEKDSKAVAILTGTEFGADVIEYRTKDQAVKALSKAKSYDLGAKKVTASGRTLFIDYAGDKHIAKVVQACSRAPDQPPPA